MTTPREAGLMAGMDDDTADLYAARIAEHERDRLYNRVAEHLAGENVGSWLGCPWCDGDTDLAETIEHEFGLTPADKDTP